MDLRMNIHETVETVTLRCYFAQLAKCYTWWQRSPDSLLLLHSSFPSGAGGSMGHMTVFTVQCPLLPIMFQVKGAMKGNNRE